jgi:hypothetical protein
MDRPLSPLSPPLRIAVACALLVFALVLLVRFAAALAADVGLWVPSVNVTLGVLAVLAGVGLWRETRWAPLALVALGAAFAAAQLVEALVLGIRPWLFALLSGAAGLVVALLLAASMRPRHS